MFVNSPVGSKTFANAWFSLNAGVQRRCAVDTCD